MSGSNKPDYTAKLITSLSSVNQTIRTSAIAKLTEMGEQVIPILIEELSSTDWRTRQSLLEVLGHLGKAEQTYAYVLVALGDEHFAVQEKAVWALGMLGNTQAVEPLIRLLQAPSVIVRRAVIKTLGLLGDKQAVTVLIEHLLSADPLTSSLAAESLGLIGDKRAVRPLSHLLSDPNDWTRGKALEALGRLKADPLLDKIIQLLQSEGHWTCYYAAWALGEIGDERAIDALVAAANTHDTFLRRQILDALRKLGYKPGKRGR